MTSKNAMTDEEYLNYLYKQSESNAPWMREEEHQLRDAFEKEMVEAYMREADGRIEQELFVKMVRDWTRPHEGLRGSMITGLKDMALTDMMKDFNVGHIPVGMLPVRALNAFAARTPRGGVVIVLNAGLMNSLHWVVRCYWALLTLYGPEPFSLQHSMLDLLNALDGLARYCGTNDVAGLTNPIVPSLSLPMIHGETMEHMRFMCLFVLAHEYGHHVLGHLNEENCVRNAVGTLPELEIYQRSHQQEFEADEFALRRLVAMDERATHVVFQAIAVLFGFLNLVEKVSGVHGGTPSHPAAVDRWMRLKQFSPDPRHEYAAEFYFESGGVSTIGLRQELENEKRNKKGEA